MEPLVGSGHCYTVTGGVSAVASNETATSNSTNNATYQRNTRNAELAFLDLLTKLYLAGVPTGRHIWRRLSGLLPNIALSGDFCEAQFQESLLKATFYHPLATQFPRDANFTRSVLKWLEQEWSGLEVKNCHNFEEVAKRMSLELRSHDLSYKTYLGVSGNFPVTLLEAPSGIVHGTTGLTTWCGASVLSSWAGDHAEILCGKQILELGAGVGFTAVALLANLRSPIRRYTVTDCHPHVLSVLHHNISLLQHFCNTQSFPTFSSLEKMQQELSARLYEEQLEPGEFPKVEWRQKCGIKVGETIVDVLQLDWRQPPRLPPVDVVIAADVVYAPHLLSPLAILIKQILRNGNDTHESSRMLSENSELESKKAVQVTSNATNAATLPEEKTKGHLCGQHQNTADCCGKVSLAPATDAFSRAAYIACTRRNHETLSEFLVELQANGLKYTLVFQTTMDAESSLFCYNEGHLPVRVYKITL